MASTHKRIMAHATLLPLFLVLSQCNEEKFSFYKDPMQGYGDATPGHEAWRLPIIEPYDLITANCCQDWNFQKSDFKGNFSADSVNFASGYILYYGYPSTYGYLDIQRQKIIRIDTYRNFVDSVNAKGITKKLYKTEAVYQCWRKTGQLPWAAEILATQGVK